MTYYEDNITCEKCGLEYTVLRVNKVMRGKDSLLCKCGNELMHWNESSIYVTKLIKNSKTNKKL